MKKQKGLWILSVALVLLIVGASVLYNSLGDKVQQDILAENEDVDNDSTDSGDVDNDDTDTNDANTDDTNMDDANVEDTTTNDVDNDAVNSEDADTGDINSDNTNSDETVSGEEDSEKEPENEDTPTLNPAKDIKVTDIDGNVVSLSDFKGKPVVLNFWASWCSVCRNEMMDFQIAYDKYKDDVVFLLVAVTDNSNETVRKASNYINKKGYTFPVYYDTLREAYFGYHIRSLPATYFIDVEGNIVKPIKGGVDRVMLDKYIAQIYSE